MQRKHFISAIVIASLLSPLSWAYTGGSGTPADPYQIAAVADWQQLMTTTDDWDKHFILTADLDLQGLTLTPVGSRWQPFTGLFDGQGFTLHNAVIDLPASDYVGLLGYVGAGGEIRDLGAEDVNVTGDRHVGGLVGHNRYGMLTSCYATGQVTGHRSGIGGLVGDIVIGTLTSCYATGRVTGDWTVGGLVGQNLGGTLTSCYATGQVTGTGDDVGGLVGDNHLGAIISCYATGHVTGTGDYVGGLVGDNYVHGTLTACFWDVETSGTSDGVGNEDPDPAGVTGKTTTQMQDINTFLDAGWDFVGESENGTEDFWKMIHPGEDYPRLSWQVEYPADIAGLYGVDFVDFAAFSLAWRSDNTSTGSWNPACDISEPPDGIIDELDLAVFCENWLTGR